MKFRFCGDADCPDWLLMQIHTLSTLTVENLKSLCEEVRLSLLDQELDYEKVKEATSGADLDVTDTKACVAAVELILKSGCCHGVGKEELCKELEQLGLHADQAGVLSGALGPQLLAPPLRLPRLTNFIAEPLGNNEFKVQMTVDDAKKIFTASHQQLALLIKDLKEVKSRMEEIQTE